VIDFVLEPELEALRDRVRSFVRDVVIPAEGGMCPDMDSTSRCDPSFRRRRVVPASSPLK
jgi:hypothetical protein